MHGFVDVFVDAFIVKIGQAEAPAATGRTHFTAHLACDGFLGNDGDAQSHQRAHIRRQRAVGARHHHHVVFAGQTGHDLGHAYILGTGELFDFFKQLDLGRAVQRGNGIEVFVQGAPLCDFGGRRFDLARFGRAGDGTHRARCIEKRCLRNIV